MILGYLGDRLWVMGYGKRLFMFFVFSLFYSISNGYADFENTGWGARPMGMGGAFVGLADDSRAIFYNPAGLAYLKRMELSGDYARIHGGLSDQSTLSSSLFSLAVPIRVRKSHEERVRNLTHLAKAEEDKKDHKIEKDPEKKNENKPAKPRGKDKDRKITFFKDMGTASLALTNFSFDGVLSENTLWLGYARKIKDRFSAGLNLKFLSQSYTLDEYTRTDPVFGRGGTDSLLTYSADLGLLYNLSPKTFIGMTASNLNSPNTSLGTSGNETLPMTLRTGLSHKHDKLNTAVDAVLQSGSYQMHAGGERWFYRQTFAARFGGSLGSRNLKNMTAGFSVNWKSIQIDYALIFPVSGVKSTQGTHRVSLVYRFGKEPSKDITVGSLEFYYSRLLDETEVLKSRLEKAEDERSRLEKVLVQEAMSRIKEKVRAEKLEVRVNKSEKRSSKKSSDNQMLRPLSGRETGFKTYITLKGDTLKSIAEHFYGKKDRWTEILNVNKDKVGRGGRVKSGTVLLIPGVAGELEASPSGTQGTLTPLGTLKPLKTKKILRPLKPLKPKDKSKKHKTKSKTYTVLEGDTLGSISQKVYGDSKRWKEIFKSNKDKIDQGTVPPGTILTIP